MSSYPLDIMRCIGSPSYKKCILLYILSLECKIHSGKYLQDIAMKFNILLNVICFRVNNVSIAAKR